jgi:parvulin-like peptidyl-prolyl isomerase
LGTVKVTDPELREYYTDQNEKAKVSYIFAGPELFRDNEVKVDQQEIDTYYDQHQGEFREEEKRRCQFVAWEKKPSAADEESIRIEAEAVAAELREGADFSKTAQERSDDSGTASKGGDLGWFGQGQMVKPFEKAAFALKTGQISDPVRTPYGWHIIKLVARKKEGGEEKIRASHILFKIEPSQKTIESLRKEIAAFISDADEEGFKIAAKARGLEIKDTAFFSKDGYIPGIGRARSLSDFAFKSQPGAISPFYENRTGFWILHLQEKKKAGIRPLEEVTADIRRNLEEEQRREMANEKLEKATSELKKGVSLEDVAKSVSLEVKTAGPFSRSEYLPDIGTKNQFVSTAFRLQPGETSGIVSTERGYYIIKVLEKQYIDEENFQVQKDEIRKKLLSQRQYEAYTTWLANLKQKAQIVDNRHYFYGE